MTNVIPFNFNQNEVRVITDETGELWFVASDVSRVLGYSDTQALTRRLESDEVQNRQIVGFGNRGVNLLNESGLYSSILGSSKPEAKPFRQWVTNDVLPAIRKTGSYSMQNAITNERTAIKITIAESAARMLRMSDTSITRMLHKVGDEEGVSTAFLPEYSDEELTRALGDLLKENDSNLSSIAANKILIDLGLLEELSRRSSGGKEKKFKSITDAGLVYGKNETSPQSPNQTQPRYFVKKFPELLDLINGWLSEQDGVA